MEILAGVESVIPNPMEPFSEVACEFIQELSVILRTDSVCQSYSDIMSFSFFCRKGNIQKLKENEKNEFRLGRGVVFHITPSNVPVNFAFSYIFGLLAGNSNIVRVTTKKIVQIDLIINKIKELLSLEKYREIHNRTSIVRYEYDDSQYNDKFSKLCDVRVIWGGNHTIQQIRTSKLSPRSFDITFADRSSVAVFDGKYMANMLEEDWKRLVQGFYNDTFYMDQNACSSPRIVIWINSHQDVKNRFWKDVSNMAMTKYHLEDGKVSDKFTKVCENAIICPDGVMTYRFGNYLYVVDIKCEKQVLSNIMSNVKFGLFYQMELESIGDVIECMDDCVQTITYCGLDKNEFGNMMKIKKCRGIDRIVPVGKALDIGLVWDGYNLLSQMSRIIQIS